MEVLTGVFLSLLNMSFTASWVILAVLAARLLLQRIPKRYTFWLWAVVLFRLMCPVSFQSVVSLIPSAQTIPHDLTMQAVPMIQSGIAPVDAAVNAALPAAEQTASVNPLQIAAALGAGIWLAGLVLLALYSFLTVQRLKTHLQKTRLPAKPCGKTEVYLLAGIRSPFVFGILRPAIYLPEDLSVEESKYVLAHEQAHLRHGDAALKPLAWLVLCVHWFNPLVWLGFFCWEKDMELYCDESVTRAYSPVQKKAYVSTLLALSGMHRFVGGCPLAFGESSVKNRIQNVLRTKKPAVGVCVAAATLLAALGIGLAANPAQKKMAASAAASQQAAGELATNESAAEKAPTAQALPLTKSAAQQCIADTLQTLTLHTDDTVSFTLPAALPTDETGKTRLTITCNVTYQAGPGESTVDSLLDSATGWRGGETYTGQLDAGKGTLAEVMLRVAFMTSLGENTYQEYAADFVRLTAPFSYEQSAEIFTPTAQVAQNGRDVTVTYTSQDGSTFTVSLTLPQGVTLAAAKGSASDTAGGGFAALQNGTSIGALALYDYAATDAATLAGLAPEADRLPMAIYGTIALPNHVDCAEDYRVVSHTATAANAVTKMRYQSPAESGEAAADIPWQAQDCVLAYDTASAPYFVALTFVENTLSAAQLAALAESITFSSVQ